MFANREPCWNI